MESSGEEDFQLERGNVFILGAGFSCSAADFPLTHDFVSRMLRDDLPDESAIVEVMGICYPDRDNLRLDHREGIRHFREPVNIEFLFNMIESLDDLQRIILRRGDLSQLGRHSGGGENYMSRLQCLVARYLWTQSIAGSPNPNLARFAGMLTPNDAIITFNWDLLMERSLDAAGIPWSYLPERDKIFVCKLHGSANWMRRPLDGAIESEGDWECTDVGHGISVVSAPVGAAYGPEVELVRGIDPRFALAYVPSLLAFGFRKDISHPPYTQLWIWASQCMSTSYRIVEIGYSLPDPDVAARHLFNYSLTWQRLFTGRGTSRLRIMVDQSRDSLRRWRSVCADDCVVIEADAMEAIKSGMDLNVPDKWY